MEIGTYSLISLTPLHKGKERIVGCRLFEVIFMIVTVFQYYY